MYAICFIALVRTQDFKRGERDFEWALDRGGLWGEGPSPPSVRPYEIKEKDKILEIPLKSVRLTGL